MKLIVTNDYDEMSAQAAEIVVALIEQNPRATLGLTTGNSPVGLYRNLVERYQAGTLALNEIRVFCTEEYLGSSPHDPFGLFAWLHREFILPCHLPTEHVFRLRGEHAEPQLACMEFDTQIQSCGGLDLIVESIGLNGHIGFNEPGSPPDAPTRILALMNDTLEYNANYWGASVPRYGLTIGLRTILTAKSILLLVAGQAKAEPLARALTGPVTPEMPASILQGLPNLVVVADSAAASLLAHEGIRHVG
ncbi:MAG TPA: glucosamine-6-phosphate deaminase [Ktedonobacteraceae bacterium]